MPVSNPGLTKKSALYCWIVLIAGVLVASMVMTQLGPIRSAFREHPVEGVGMTLCTLFIAYFWLNGVKDVAYTAWYHLFLRKRMRVVPTRRKMVAPRVAMIYCTCDDFEPVALVRSMQQRYLNFEVVILDDSKNPEIMAHVDRFAWRHDIRVIRRADNAGFKAGNMNHGLAQLEYDYFVILDSDEIVPPNFIDRCLDYFADGKQVGIVQGNHRATRNRNEFMRRFSIGVDSHWITYQSVKNEYGFMSLLGHGAMVSRECFEAVGGFPALVAEDICLSIEARNRGWMTVFAADVICEEEYPVDFLAFKKRHNKWTQGNMEFIKRYTGAILRSRMTWFEKLDIVLFTYSLPLTALFSLYVVINVIVFPAMGYTMNYPLWMLVPTVIFLFAPMLNDIVFHWRELTRKELAKYLLQSTLLYGSMFFVSLRASLKSAFGKSVFLVTPKNDVTISLGTAIKANRAELIFGLALSGVVIWLTGSIFGVLLLVVPALFMTYMSVLHQPIVKREKGRHREELVALNEMFEDAK